MKIFLLIITLLAYSYADLCVQPQRTFFMSFPTLGKRDALNNLFNESNQKMTALDNNYTDNGLQANFKIPGLLAQAYYNDHHQVESYLEALKVNVTMGTINIGSRFNYSITYSSSNKSGTIFARGQLDPSYFTKKLMIIEGNLEWEPDVVPALTFTQLFTIESSTPKLTEPQLSIFSSMINNGAGSRKVKTQIINQINAQYGPLLKSHLNHEELISAGNITYKYRDITINIQNFVKNFEISNANSKGLVSYFLYGLPNSTQNCTALGKDFDKQYGGFQEIISFGVIRSIVKEAVSKGLFDVTIDNTWDVNTFQFYMGDLGNSVPYANYVPANDKFTVNCKYDKASQDGVKVIKYENDTIYVSLPVDCQAIYKTKPIIGIKMSVSFVVLMSLGQTTLNPKILSTGTFSRTYTSLDPNYKVESQILAELSISEVLNGLVGKSLFGSKFPTIYRRYPAARVQEDRIILFDPSQQ